MYGRDVGCRSPRSGAGCAPDPLAKRGPSYGLPPSVGTTLAYKTGRLGTIDMADDNAVCLDDTDFQRDGWKRGVGFGRRVITPAECPICRGVRFFVGKRHVTDCVLTWNHR